MIEKTRAISVLFAALALITTVAQGELKVAGIFGNDMILQRDMPVPVWGTAEPGEKVTVEFAGQTRTAAADKKGTWRLNLAALNGSKTPTDMSIKGTLDTKGVTLAGITVGEVWLVLGDNLPAIFTMDSPTPYPANRIVPRRGDPKRIQSIYSVTPRKSYGSPMAWNPSGKRGPSHDVVTTYFSNQLYEELDVPIGIIRVWANTLQSCTPAEGFATEPALADIASAVDTWSPDTERGAKLYAEWLKESKQWASVMQRAFEDGQHVAPSMPPVPPGPVPDDPTQPTVTYNALISPLVPFAIRGVLHTDRAMNERDPLYTENMKALIKGYRAVFERPDLPFCLTQFSNPGDGYVEVFGDGYSMGKFDANKGMPGRVLYIPHRERQGHVLDLENVGIVVTLDIHGSDWGQGSRFAQWALSAAYGRNGDAGLSPVCKEHHIKGREFHIDFDRAGSGLMTAFAPIGGAPAETKDEQVRFLQIAGADKVWRSARSSIEGTTLIAWNEKVDKPVAVRYAYECNVNTPNLYDRDGLPVVPFRTDDWPLATFDELVASYSEKSVEELTSRLGYPTDISSHAAAKALADKGEKIALPLINTLLQNDDRDLRCGALRTLGFLYEGDEIAMGAAYLEERKTEREVTPALANAGTIVCRAAKDDDSFVRALAASAALSIDIVTPDLVDMYITLAGDKDASVRRAALQVTKFRLNDDHAEAHVRIGFATLDNQSRRDPLSLYQATKCLNRYYRFVDMDYAHLSALARRIDLRQGGEYVNKIGEIYSRGGQTGLPWSDHLLDQTLHLASLGYREQLRHGAFWKIASHPDHHPAIEKKIEELREAIPALKKEGTPLATDRYRRFETAIELLDGLLTKARTKKKE